MEKTWKGNSRYNIVKYEKKYYQSYADLFRIAYQKTEPLGATNHRISHSPFGTPIIYLMIYNKKVVGAHSIYPIMFRLRKKPQLVSTAPWGYLRLRRPDYAATDLARWADAISGQDWDEVYVFFKHEDDGAGPTLAANFLRMVG